MTTTGRSASQFSRDFADYRYRTQKPVQPRVGANAPQSESHRFTRAKSLCPCTVSSNPRFKSMLWRSVHNFVSALEVLSDLIMQDVPLISYRLQLGGLVGSCQRTSLLNMYDVHSSILCLYTLRVHCQKLV